MSAPTVTARAAAAKPYVVAAACRTRPSAGPVAIVVHRRAAGVQAERISEAAFAFLQLLFAGEPLGTLLQNTESEAALLAEQFAKGRLSVMDIGTAEDRHASR